MDGTRRVAPAERLEIGIDLYEQMIAYVRDLAPEEGCGLIAFGGERAVKLFPGTNIERSQTRYSMDPNEVVAAFDEIEQQGWKLGAIFHSHPRSAAHPSNTDLRYAFYPEALMVIISLAHEPPEVRASQVDGRVHEVPIVVLPAHGEFGTSSGDSL
jgi:proteasome lid subunit RPN8/RPN11